MSNSSPVVLAMKFDGERKNSAFPDGLGARRVIDLNTDTDILEIINGARYAVLWKPKAELFKRLPDLEVIFSAGAGVDHLLQSPGLPDLPIVRFVDHTLTTRMSEWICLQCLMHLRQQRVYDGLQRKHSWQELPQPEASEITVGIMGMGVLGQDAARKLRMLGFRVNGWSRSGKQIDGIGCFDQSGLNAFLSKTDFLVGLLPLTPETKGIFNRTVFAKLKRNSELASPVFINAGRGGSQKEDDIVACLRDGTLGGVSLDVFESEPLAADSPLWDFEQAILTPHAAATSDVFALGKHVGEQISRYERGEKLQYLVDRNSGY